MKNTCCYVALLLSLLSVSLTIPTHAVALDGKRTIPHLNEAGHQGFQKFNAAPTHRAFAIAPGGVWAWVSDGATPDVAKAEALKACRHLTEQPCHIYAVNDQVLFDENMWQKSWVLNTRADDDSPVGLGRGRQFPNLVLTAPDGRSMTLKGLRGKPVFLHFWGSWCPPCQTEFVDLQKLYDALVGDDAITFVLVQGRESIAKSKRWVRKNGFTMPLFDSGHQGRGDKSFHLAGGEMVADRRLASVYPSTYILDANGIVVFRQTGPEEQWEQYETLLRNLARQE